MEVAAIEVDREEARKRVQEFTAKRRKRLTEMDQALFRGYKALAEGLTLIDINKAIRDGGYFGENYCPKLAIARSDIERIYFDHRFTWDSGAAQHGGRYCAWRWTDPASVLAENPLYVEASRVADAAQRSRVEHAESEGLQIELEPNTINSPPEERKQSRAWYKSTYHALVPPIPFHLRPNGDASKYFILWEVEKWEEYRSPRAPGDPLLLERIAHPIYVVVAQWDLSELEKRILESFRR